MIKDANNWSGVHRGSGPVYIVFCPGNYSDHDV